MVSELKLLPAADDHFAWLLGERVAPDDLRLPPGGLDRPEVLRWLRQTLPTLGGHGSWLMVADGEVVGGCGYKRPPSAAGDAEIGYGVAPARRRRGFAARAGRLIVEAARSDPRVRALTAETAVGNVASQRVLATNGFFKVGRGHDDDEGETILWRLPLRLPPPAKVSPPLLESRLDALYETDAGGHIVCTNSWERQPAPRFHLMLTPGGARTRFRADVPKDAARELAALAAQEGWQASCEGPPRTLPRYVELLSPLAPIQEIVSGPAFAATGEVVAYGPVLDIDAGNAELLRGRLGDWLADAPHRRPFVAVVQGEQAVSLCASVRISPAVHCAGVETHPDHRGRGHALTAVSGWAQRVQALGATPFYSTSWGNAASRAVATRLGFQFAAADLRIT